MFKNIKILSSLAVASFLVGCGGGGTSGSNTVTETTSVTIVDPYIQGATVFWDKNNNGVMDAGESESTVSDANGKAVISGIIPEGEILVMNTKGKHGCNAYLGTLKAKYSTGGIISPLTTLEVLGFTKTEIVTLLGDTITEEDITKNPMELITTSATTLTTDDIKLIKANMAVNTFLEKNGFDATIDTLNTNVADLTNSLSLMDILIKPENITSTNNALNVIKSALAINSYVLAQSDVATTLNNFALNTNGTRDTYFNNLLTALTTNENAGLNSDGTVNTVCYSIDEYISDLTNKTWFTNMDNDSYMSFKDTSIFYEYENSREIPYPNEEEPTFNLTFKKVDETHYENYVNGVLSDTCEILSYSKVSSISGISVDAVEVKQDCTYTDNTHDYPNTHIGVTKTQATQITNAINANIISASSGYKEGYLQNEGNTYSVYKEANSWYLDSNLSFSNGISYQDGSQIGTYTLENGMIKNNEDGDIWYDKIISINPNYIKGCSLEVGETICGSEMQFYLYFDANLAQTKLSQLNGN